MIDMNKTFNLRTEERSPKWRLIDASGKTLGRLTTMIADVLRGKDKPMFTPHSDAGDYVVVVNAEKVSVTGKKESQKVYRRHSSWVGGMKEASFSEIMNKKPEKIIQLAVKGMMPKTKLARAQQKKLKVYVGSDHPHAAQVS